MSQLPNKEMIDRLKFIAMESARRAYAPYSNFHVGCAILLSNGDILNGCNVENVSYGLTNCAERTAIFTAVASGKLKETDNIELVVVYTPDNPTPISPCGACRQVIYEFGEDATVLSFSATEEKTWKMKELLLDGFSPRLLKNKG